MTTRLKGQNCPERATCAMWRKIVQINRHNLRIGLGLIEKDKEFTQLCAERKRYGMDC